MGCTGVRSGEGLWGGWRLKDFPDRTGLRNGACSIWRSHCAGGTSWQPAAVCGEIKKAMEPGGTGGG